MSDLGRIYISTSVKFNENSFPFSNDSNFSKQESERRDHGALFEKFQDVSFSVNSSYDFTQLTAAHSCSQDTTGNTECSPKSYSK